MASLKTGPLTFSELLQVRVTKQTKKDIVTYIKQKRISGKEYSQSDFLRDAISSLLYSDPLLQNIKEFITTTEKNILQDLNKLEESIKKVMNMLTDIRELS